VPGEGIMTSNWATVMTVSEGQVDNTFDYAPLSGTKLENYDITVVTGKIAVVQAANIWTTEPAIEGWTYGESAKTPVGAAKFGAVSFDYSPNSVGAAGDYTMTASVTATANYTGLTKDVTFTIAARPIVPGGEDDPEKPDPSKPLPEGAVSKYDFVGMYDGVAHTIDTNALMKVTYTHATDLTFSYALTEKGTYQSAPFAFKDVVATSFWYRIEAPNYSNYCHEARVVITNRPVTIT